MTDIALSRRTLLAGAAALPLAGSLSSQAVAAGHAGPANAKQQSFAIGDFEVSTLLAGTRTVEDDSLNCWRTGRATDSDRRATALDGRPTYSVPLPRPM